MRECESAINSGKSSTYLHSRLDKPLKMLDHSSVISELFDYVMGRILADYFFGRTRLKMVL